MTHSTLETGEISQDPKREGPLQLEKGFVYQCVWKGGFLCMCVGMGLCMCVCVCGRVVCVCCMCGEMVCVGVCEVVGVGFGGLLGSYMCVVWGCRYV